MKLILFSKTLKGRSVPELAGLGPEFGIDGYDLCVRPEHPVSPENVKQSLPEACRILRENGLDVPMVTGNFDLKFPDHPAARPILSAMDESDVRIVKLGYYQFDPRTMNYQSEVDSIRRAFEGWQGLSMEYGVRVCYHTHSNRCMGLNAGALAHLLDGFDPRCLGAYLDTGHLVAEGEKFRTAAGMVRPYLSVVALKDVLLSRGERNGHGFVGTDWVEAGKGMVDWTAVFECLDETGFDGPVSVHCEFEAREDDRVPAMKRETEFFRRFVRKEE